MNIFINIISSDGVFFSTLQRAFFGRRKWVFFSLYRFKCVYNDPFLVWLLINFNHKASLHNLFFVLRAFCFEWLWSCLFPTSETNRKLIFDRSYTHSGFISRNTNQSTSSSSRWLYRWQSHHFYRIRDKHKSETRKMRKGNAHGNSIFRCRLCAVR